MLNEDSDSSETGERVSARKEPQGQYVSKSTGVPYLNVHREFLTKLKFYSLLSKPHRTLEIVTVPPNTYHTSLTDLVVWATEPFCWRKRTIKTQQ